MYSERSASLAEKINLILNSAAEKGFKSQCDDAIYCGLSKRIKHIYTNDFLLTLKKSDKTKIIYIKSLNYGTCGLYFSKNAATLEQSISNHKEIALHFPTINTSALLDVIRHSRHSSVSFTCKACKEQSVFDGMSTLVKLNLNEPTELLHARIDFAKHVLVLQDSANEKPLCNLFNRLIKYHGEKVPTRKEHKARLAGLWLYDFCTKNNCGGTKALASFRETGHLDRMGIEDKDPREFERWLAASRRCVESARVLSIV